MIKRMIIVMSCLLFLLGCGDSKKNMATKEGTTVEESTFVVENAELHKDSTSDELESDELNHENEQIKLSVNTIEEYIKGIKEWHWEDYYFTLTDLDQDGKLEVIIASCLGSGRYTFLSIFETDDSYNKQEKIEEFDFQGEDLNERAPDIMLKEIRGVYDEENDNYQYYIFDDLTDGPIVRHSDLLELTIGGVNSIKSVLDMENELSDSGEIVSHYYNSEKKEISKEEYDANIEYLEKNYNVTYYLNWINAGKVFGGDESMEALINEILQAQRIEYKNLN